MKLFGHSFTTVYLFPPGHVVGRRIAVGYVAGEVLERGPGSWAVLTEEGEAAATRVRGSSPLRAHRAAAAAGD